MHIDARLLRRTVLAVAALNFSYFFVEFAVALSAGSVSLLADSVDFLEDTAVNLLIFAALGWHLGHRALAGKAMAVIILGRPRSRRGKRFRASPIRRRPTSHRSCSRRWARSRSTARAPGC